MTGPVTRVKVFGERNCGTTLAESILRKSDALDVLPPGAPLRVQRIAARSGAREFGLDLWDSLNRGRTLGWKHAYIDEETVARIERHGVACIALTKHPLSWLVSLRRHPYHLQVSRTSPELTHRRVRRERLPHPPSSLIDVWRMKTQRYLDLQERGVLSLLRFEDFVTDPPGTLATAMASRVDTGALAAVPKSVKKDVRTADQIRDHYAAEAWRGQSLPWDREEAARIEPELLAALGYDA